MAAQTQKIGASSDPTSRAGGLQSHPILVTGALLIVAFAFGGVHYGLANLVVQLTALGVLAVHRDSFVAFWRSAP